MKTTMWSRERIGLAACAVGMAGLLAQATACSRPDPGTFKSPEEAVAALGSLIGSGDEKRSDEVFGPGSWDLFDSGDAADDQKGRLRVKELIAEKVAFYDVDANTKVALFGAKEWPFPIPLVQSGERWRFNTEDGRSELLNRRIGYYELSTIESLRAYVESQHEYAAVGRDGNPSAFAQRFFSTEGRNDGLYWPAAEGQPESPLGDRLASASERSADPRPYHGYWYRILTAQGKNAPGGAKNYVDAHGLMTSGFALIAWPAKYGNSGVTTFMINQLGIPFQKDLGADTDKTVATIQSFDPDESWNATADRLPADANADDDDDDNTSQ